MSRIVKGKVWKFGRDIDTDVIIAACYLTSIEPKELAEHCLEAADADFPSQVKENDVIVAGENFGCGSSREHAPMAIQGSGIGVVVAASFARIFFRNAINLALPVVICPEAVDAVEKGDEIEVDLEQGLITVPKSGKQFQAVPLPEFMGQLFSMGGIVPFTRQRLKALGKL